MVVLMRSLLLASLAMAAFAGASAVKSDSNQEPPVQTVDVAAERFSFTPSEIRMTAGTTLHLRLQSDDTAHGFHIIGTDVNVEIPKRSRGMATVEFAPERAGRYTFECSKLCGAGHSFMRGVIIVADAKAGPR